MLTVLTETSQTEVNAPAGASLWLTAADAERATGWTLKPEGLCRGEVCIPVPPGEADNYVNDGQVNLSAFWERMGNPCVGTDGGDVWFLGEGAGARNEAMRSLEAPHFTLPDFDGKLHSLHDFRRMRVLLITWASW